LHSAWHPALREIHDGHVTFNLLFFRELYFSGFFFRIFFPNFFSGFDLPEHL
jgi:hypothetical protein